MTCSSLPKELRIFTNQVPTIATRSTFPSFLPAYAISLVLTFISLFLMDTAQPALLYIVPCTLVPVAALALARGEFKEFWGGDSEVETVREEGEPVSHFFCSIYPTGGQQREGQDLAAVMFKVKEKYQSTDWKFWRPRFNSFLSPVSSSFFFLPSPFRSISISQTIQSAELASGAVPGAASGGGEGPAEPTGPNPPLAEQQPGAG